MKQIWKQKIDEIDKRIADTPIGNTVELTRLYGIRDRLERAFNNCG